MDPFLKAAALVLITVILTLALGSKGKETGILLTMAACVMVIILGISYLQPVMDFLRKLETLGNLNGDMTGILFKVAGIGIISEIVGMVCADAGNNSLGKALNIAAAGVILWLSIPIFDALLELIHRILGEI